MVLGLSFYTLNAGYRTANRMATIETQLKNPAAYILNLEYNINTLTVIGDKLAGRRTPRRPPSTRPRNTRKTASPCPTGGT